MLEKSVRAEVVKDQNKVKVHVWVTVVRCLLILVDWHRIEKRSMKCSSDQCKQSFFKHLAVIDNKYRHLILEPQ